MRRRALTARRGVPTKCGRGFEISSVNKDSNDLEEIRRRIYVYVDKTAWLHRLAMAEGEKMFFLARQRSFGKSSFLMNF